MKQIGLLLFAILLTTLYHTNLSAQTIQGIVLSKDQKPVEYATVILQKQDSTYLGSTITDTLGRFSIPSSTSKYRLIVQHLLYNTYQANFSNQQQIAIVLVAKENQIGEVVVKGERPVVQLKAGKLSYDIPSLIKNVVASTAYDVLLQLPGVREQDGMLMLAGTSSLAILVNGQTTNLPYENLIAMLKSYPSDMVKNAEVMYSAPPQYHVRGAAINLLLRGYHAKNNLQAQVNSTYNQKHYGSVSNGASIFYATPKASIDLSYSLDINKSYSGLDLYSKHTVNGQENNIYQSNSGTRNALNHMARVGAELTIADSQKIAITYNAQVTSHLHNTEYANGDLSNSINRRDEASPIGLHNVIATYNIHNKYKLGAEYTTYNDHTNQEFEEQNASNTTHFIQESKQQINRYRLFTDANNTFGNQWTMTFGGQYMYASDDSQQSYQMLTNTTAPASNVSDNLKEYTANIYVGLEKTFSSKLSVNASATAEYYKLGDYSEKTIFPTFTAVYPISQTQILQLSMSSDKTYPSYWELHGATSYMNSYEQIQGNPLLRPYRDYTTQLSYILSGKYIATAYYSYLKDYFMQLPYQLPNELQLVFKTLNFDYRKILGLNIVIPVTLAERLKSRLTINSFYDKVKASAYHNITVDRDNFVFYSRIDNYLEISKKPNIKMEISGAYISPNIQGTASLSEMWSIDSALRWIFANEKAELLLKGSDLFNSWSPNMTIRYKGQNLKMNIVPDSRMLTLSFIYKFRGYNKSHANVDNSRFGTK